MRGSLFIDRNPIESAYFAAVFTCVVILALRVAARWWRPRRLAADGNVRCGTCCYILSPGSSTVCPECGRDVREHGLITTTAPLRGIALGPAYVLIALLALPPALRVSPALRDWHPFGWRYHASVMVTLPHEGTGIAARWCVQGDGTGRYFGRRPRHLMIYRNDGLDPRYVLLVLRPADLMITYRATSQMSEKIDRPLDREIMEAFVRQTTGEAVSPAGRATVDDAMVARLAQEMLAAARHLAAGNVPRQGKPDASVGYSLSDWVQLGSIFCTAAIATALGIVVLRRLARPLQARKRRRWRQEAHDAALVDSQPEAATSAPP